MKLGGLVGFSPFGLLATRVGNTGLFAACATLGAISATIVALSPARRGAGAPEALARKALRPNAAALRGSSGHGSGGPIFARAASMINLTKAPLRSLLGWTGAVAAAAVLLEGWRQARYPLAGRVVLIAGGSRGLGLLLAREYARHGARLVLTARDAAELERARDELQAAGAEVFIHSCDVSDQNQVFALIERVVERYGPIDVLVNAAGQIEVGPLAAMTARDFRTAMDVNFWGAFNMVNAALPHLSPASARIVNISSIGGIISVPHLLPYSASKFALTGFSLGLRAELASQAISVVTVCPGLMRTGSPVQAQFKGDAAAEYAWFSVADSLPLLSMSGERAARAIVRASRRGDRLLVLGLPAKLGALAQGLFPSAVVAANTLVNRLLPSGTSTAVQSGGAIEPRPARWLTALSDRAAERNNELG